MRDLAALLTTLVERIVIDKTGVTGAYDFEMTRAPEQPQRDRGRDDILPPIDPDAPSLLQLFRNNSA